MIQNEGVLGSLALDRGLGSSRKLLGIQNGLGFRGLRFRV